MNDEQILFYYLAQVKAKQSVIEVLRVGTIHDRGLKITGSMLSNMAKNFQDNVYGTEIQVNLEHKRGSEAAGWVKDLYVQDEKLMARIEWTEMGQEKIIKKLFRFVSAEFASKFPHHENGSLIKDVFIGLALTNTPALKAQEALMLSEEIGLIYKKKRMFQTFLEEMKKREIVSLADKELMRSLLATLSEEEQEAVAVEVAEVEAKPEEAEPAEEPAEEPTEEPATEDEPAEEPEEEPAPADTTLAEKDAEIVALKEELAEKQKAIELKEVTADAEQFMLSEDTKVGFPVASQEKLVGFMLKLSAEDRAEFVKLMGSIEALEMGAIGGDGVKKEVVEAEKLQDALVARTEELLAEATKKGEVLTVEAAQKQAQAELIK